MPGASDERRGNSGLVTVHNPELGIKDVIAFDYKLLRAADDESREEAKLRLTEARDIALNALGDPWAEYKLRCKR